MGYDLYLYAFTVLPTRPPLSVPFNIPHTENFNHLFCRPATSAFDTAARLYY